MKIAVLIAGEYREFAIAHKFWTFLSWPDVDCYFATWKHSLLVQVDTPLDDPLPPINEIITAEQIRSLIKVVDLDITDRSESAKMYYVGWSMIERWKSAISLMQKSGTQYDRVILIRPDLALSYDEDMFRQFIRDIDDSLYSVNSVYHSINDRMLLGTQDSILKLMQLPMDELSESSNPGIPSTVDIHPYLAKHCFPLYKKLLNIPILDTIVRTSCRTLINPSFIECRDREVEWWKVRLAPDARLKNLQTQNKLKKLFLKDLKT